MNTLPLLLTLILSQLAGGKASPTSVAQLEAMARGTLAKVEKMRNQKLSEPLKMGVKDKPAITKFIQMRLEEEYGAERVKAEGHLLKLQGLLPRKLDYGAFLTGLLTEQVAGFYDHIRKELHIAAWLPVEMQEPVMAHEIFHAIQDQEWGGGKLIDSKIYPQDSVVAHAALLEGDATVVMLNYTAGSDVSESGFAVRMTATALAMQMDTPQFPVMSSAPAYLKQSLIFPYQQGLLFIGELRNKGLSWAKIRDVYRNPPQSTEQIIHPERYYPKPDVPSEVTIKEPLLPGFKRDWAEITGEFHFRQLLLSQLKIAPAVSGAAGWDGDLTVLETKGDAAVAVTVSTWDTEKDALEFITALRKAHTKQTGKKANLVTHQAGTTAIFVFSDTKTLAEDALKRAIANHTVTRR